MCTKQAWSFTSGKYVGLSMTVAPQSFNYSMQWDILPKISLHAIWKIHLSILIPQILWLIVEPWVILLSYFFDNFSQMLAFTVKPLTNRTLYTVGLMRIIMWCVYFFLFTATSTSIDRSAPIEIGLQRPTQGKFTPFMFGLCYDCLWAFATTCNFRSNSRCFLLNLGYFH